MLIPQTWAATVLALASAIQLAYAKGITDIKVTVCDSSDCSLKGYRKIPQDLNKFSRGQYVHLHYTDKDQEDGRDPITHLTILQDDDVNHHREVVDWEKIEGNLNAGTRGPPLTLYVKRDPAHAAPIESLVVKYGYDSHAAIGYDRYPMDLNTGTGGQWVHLYYKRAQTGRRDPITHIAVKACPLPMVCAMEDSSWTRVNRAIKTSSFTKRYLYLFYKSVPGQPPISNLRFTLNDGGSANAINLGVKASNHQDIFLKYEYASGRYWDGGNSAATIIDNLAVELGSNPIPYGWSRTELEDQESQERDTTATTVTTTLPDWNAQIVYRTGAVEVPPTPELRFREDGSFKIVQFADIHMATGTHMCFNAPADKNPCIGDVDTLDMMQRMLDVEKPDLVVFSGDNVDGLTSSDAYSTILKYTKPVIDRKLPWAIIFGNHDEEGDLSREEMMHSARDVPYSLSERGPVDIWGTGNYVLKIWPSSKSGGTNQDHGKKRHQFALYFLDSGAYSFNLEHPGWDWIKENQVEWFRHQSAALTTEAEAVDGVIPNALAFFHIPIPEYEPSKEKDDNDDDEGRQDDVRRRQRESDDGDDDEQHQSMVGEKREGVSTPSYNSGMFAAIAESKDVRATTAGHDHLNDYCLLREGIQLCYGGGTGYGSYGSSSVSRRSRVFEILKHGARVDTWKRLDNEEMTIVSLQTLFAGPKVSRPSPGGKPEDGQSRRRPGTTTGKNRSSQEFWENIERGGQYILGAIKNQS